MAVLSRSPAVCKTLSQGLGMSRHIRQPLARGSPIVTVFRHLHRCPPALWHLGRTLCGEETASKFHSMWCLLHGESAFGGAPRWLDSEKPPLEPSAPVSGPGAADVPTRPPPSPLVSAAFSPVGVHPRVSRESCPVCSQYEELGGPSQSLCWWLWQDSAEPACTLLFRPRIVCPLSKKRPLETPKLNVGKSEP